MLIPLRGETTVGQAVNTNDTRLRARCVMNESAPLGERVVSWKNFDEVTKILALLTKETDGEVCVEVEAT